MGKPVIGFDNFFNTLPNTETDEDALGFEYQNSYNGNTYDYWQPPTPAVQHYILAGSGSIIPVDYFALARHNLASAGYQVKLQRDSAQAFTTPTDVSSYQVLADDSPFIWIEPGAAQQDRYFRLLFDPIGTPTEPLRVAGATIGEVFRLPKAVRSGGQLPRGAVMDTITNSMSVNGEFIGRSVIKRGVEFSISVSVESLAFMRGDWQTFIDYALERPFWFLWNEDYPEDVVYVWLKGRPNTPTYDGNHTTLSTTLTLQGIRT